jgi:hypothetical protein
MCKYDNIKSKYVYIENRDVDVGTSQEEEIDFAVFCDALGLFLIVYFRCILVCV